MCDYKPGILENSAKMVLLFHLIEESVRTGDKLLVFRWAVRQQTAVTRSLPSTLFQFVLFFLFTSSAVRVCPR